MRSISAYIVMFILLAGCARVYFVYQPDLYKSQESMLNDDIRTSDEGYRTSLYKDDWELVWHDEFEGVEIDTTYWTHEVNGDGGGNNELQFYTDSRANSWLKNGFLHIKAIKENYKGKAYTSARLNSKNKADFKYGRFDIRAKIPVQKGIWPAIWMLPTDYAYGSWPLSGEIDIMESVGHEPTTVYGTVHYGAPWPNNKHSGGQYKVQKGDLSTEFHVYSVEWEEDEIRWYVDDSLYSTKRPNDLKPFKWPFDQKFHLLINLAIGGDWPGDPDPETSFPKYMFVDYVRVYQRDKN